MRVGGEEEEEGARLEKERNHISNQPLVPREMVLDGKRSTNLSDDKCLCMCNSAAKRSTILITREGRFCF